jgi:alpha-mannosidase
MTATMKSAPSAELGHGVTTRIILHADEPYLDLEVTAHDKPADPWPEAGWLCLPLKVDSPRFRLGRPGSIIDPAKDVIRGANRHLFGIHTGVAAFDHVGRGAGVCSLDSPLVSLETPGGWKYSLDFVPHKSAVYVHLFNNQWTTNFRMWNQGTWTWRVRVWPMDRFEAASSLIAPSLEARYPLLAARAEGRGGPLPNMQTGLQVSRQGVLVTAFGPNPDGAGTILRLWELAGVAGPCEVRLPARVEALTVQPVDLRGQSAGAPIKVAGGAFTCDLRAFAPASFVVP